MRMSPEFIPVGLLDIDTPLPLLNPDFGFQFLQEDFLQGPLGFEPLKRVEKSLQKIFCRFV